MSKYFCILLRSREGGEHETGGAESVVSLAWHLEIAARSVRQNVQ